MSETRVEEAVGLGVTARLRIIRAFFIRFPGPGTPPGLGRALIDFVEWLAASGRLDDVAGSPWWKALNGCLILDLADAMDDVDDPANTWCRYVRRQPSADAQELQDRLWHAHQVSLHRAIPACWDLFTAETEHERAFIEAAMEIVDLAALHSQPTDTDLLAESTRRLYPDHYPLTAPFGDELARVRHAALEAHTGPAVGLYSDIWASRRRAG